MPLSSTKRNKKLSADGNISHATSSERAAAHSFAKRSEHPASSLLSSHIAILYAIPLPLYANTPHGFPGAPAAFLIFYHVFTVLQDVFSLRFCAALPLFFTALPPHREYLRPRLNALCAANGCPKSEQPPHRPFYVKFFRSFHIGYCNLPSRLL